ncbi:acyl-CoA thioesterase [Pseudomonas sp. X10]
MSTASSSASNPARSAARKLPLARNACSFWTQEKLRNADTDQFHHVNNAVISTLLEAARMEILAGEGLKASMAGKLVVVAHLSIDFLSEVYFPGVVEIGSCTLRVGRTSFELAQGLFVGSQCCASAQATCVLIDVERREPTAISDVIRAHLLKEA